MTTPMQSPIDLPANDDAATDTDQSGPTLSFHYRADSSRIESVGRIPHIYFNDGATLQIDDRPYRLLQLHWHTPAEHAVDSARDAAELHLVHANPDDPADLAVVGLRCAADANAASNPAVTALINAVQHQTTLPAHTFTPPTGRYWHYAGSLTTPPYSEGVHWFVAHTPLTITPDQANTLTQLTQGPNCRDLQPRNHRPIQTAHSAPPS